MGFRWKGAGLGEMGDELARRASRIPDAVHDVGASYASRMQSTAQDIAPWTDRTGNARANLTGVAEREGDNTIVQLFNTIEEYPIYLELGTPPRENGHPGMAPRPSILPAMEQHQGEMFETASRLVMAMLGGAA